MRSSYKTTTLKKSNFLGSHQRECLRLMGFEDEDVHILEKAHPRRKNCMSSILYKQAGNSVVVDVLERILKEIERLEK